MLKILAWVEKVENSLDEAFLRLVGEQEPRLLRPLDALIPEAEREYEYANRRIQLERLQREFFWPPEPGCGPW